MALVRCSCVVDLVTEDGGPARIEVHLMDPDCGYVVHRLAAAMASGPAIDGVPR